jgi:hypothetical protein
MINGVFLQKLQTLDEVVLELRSFQFWSIMSTDAWAMLSAFVMKF